ncbi:ABC transporter ATP-binding protein [Streptomyces sp. Q6]|uniref:ABC transporter ATP-binding protein n=1 Tax=Streptomyces citrinus TaxID=3118173 RepID=A0ACD5AKT3_9ACTN
MSAAPVLDVTDLSVEFPDPTGTRPPVRAVRGVSFRLAAGDTLGIVGESGSGKSTTALALMRMLPGTGRVTGGSVRLGDTDLATLDDTALRAVRGDRVGMIFQDPLTSLNPVLTIGRHLDEVLRAHGRGDRAARRARSLELLDLVGIHDAAGRLDDHPHQYSGGMRQRVMIALALANDPEVLLADEPTTALDATVQDQILGVLDTATKETGTALVLITHNLGVVARACDRVAVMYGGRIVEEGPTRDVLHAPRHPYSAGLLAAVPRLDRPAGTRLEGIAGSPPDLSLPLAGCAFAPRCARATQECGTTEPPVTEDRTRAACLEPIAAADTPGPARATTDAPRPARHENAARRETVLTAENLHKHFPASSSRRRADRRETRALDGVDLTLTAGETLGVVGESGSGKSTLARTLIGIHPATSGTVTFRGTPVAPADRRQLHDLRRQVQLVFQDPYASLNPRLTVGRIIAEPLIAFGIGTERDRPREVARLLEQVGLDPSAADRHPRDFSGGQRQRIGIARALAPSPAVLICDEPVSALDVSVQAQVVNLLADLQRDLDLALVFIAHDLAVVRQVSHRIAVMRHGRIVETGPADDLVENPRHPYTRTLLAAAPEPVVRGSLTDPHTRWEATA